MKKHASNIRKRVLTFALRFIRSPGYINQGYQQRRKKKRQRIRK